MIIVVETWTLKEGLEVTVTNVMQIMDDLLGPRAHNHAGWCGHARFFQSQEAPERILMLYPWRSRDLHEHLCSQEEPFLKSFYEQYCLREREVHYYEELDVDVHLD